MQYCSVIISSVLRRVNYIVTWLSVVGPVVGLDVPLSYCTEVSAPDWSSIGTDLLWSSCLSQTPLTQRMWRGHLWPGSGSQRCQRGFKSLEHSRHQVFKSILELACEINVLINCTKIIYSCATIKRFSKTFF